MLCYRPKQQRLGKERQTTNLNQGVDLEDRATSVEDLKMVSSSKIIEEEGDKTIVFREEILNSSSLDLRSHASGATVEATMHTNAISTRKRTVLHLTRRKATVDAKKSMRSHTLCRRMKQSPLVLTQRLCLLFQSDQQV